MSPEIIDAFLLRELSVDSWMRRSIVLALVKQPVGDTEGENNDSARKNIGGIGFLEIKNDHLPCDGHQGRGNNDAHMDNVVA